MKFKQVCILISSVLVLGCCGVTDTGAIPAETTAQGTAVSTDILSDEDVIGEKSPDEASGQEEVTASPESDTDAAAKDSPAEDSSANETDTKETVSEDENSDANAEEETADTAEDKKDDEEASKPADNSGKPSDNSTSVTGDNQNTEDENRGCVGDEALVW